MPGTKWGAKVGASAKKPRRMDKPRSEGDDEDCSVKGDCNEDIGLQTCCMIDVFFVVHFAANDLFFVDHWFALQKN